VPSESILTIGMDCPPAHRDVGIFWSLPLSRYRFYGPPKVATRSLCTDSERVSGELLNHIALGSLLANWNHIEYEIPDYARIVSKTYDYLVRFSSDPDSSAHLDTSNLHKFLTLEPNWLRLFADTAKKLVASTGQDREMFLRLVGVGQRRGAIFLAYQPALFGLHWFSNFFKVLNSTESKISALRRLAARSAHRDGVNLLIRYRNAQFNENGGRIGNQNLTSLTSILREHNISKINGVDRNVPADYFEYASAITQRYSSSKRSRDGSPVSIGTHNRWILNIASVSGEGEEPMPTNRIPNEHLFLIEDLRILRSYPDTITLIGDPEDRNRFDFLIGDDSCALFAHFPDGQRQGHWTKEQETFLDDFEWH
jgi:hypothetical protein